jgi:hypothetical protein
MSVLSRVVHISERVLWNIKSPVNDVSIGSPLMVSTLFPGKKSNPFSGLGERVEDSSRNQQASTKPFVRAMFCWCYHVSRDPQQLQLPFVRVGLMLWLHGLLIFIMKAFSAWRSATCWLVYRLETRAVSSRGWIIINLPIWDNKFVVNKIPVLIHHSLQLRRASFRFQIEIVAFPEWKVSTSRYPVLDYLSLMRSELWLSLKPGERHKSVFYLHEWMKSEFFVFTTLFGNRKKYKN